MKTFNFTIPKDMYTYLNSEDISFFYQMIVQPYEDSRSYVFLDWTEDLEIWVNKNGIIIRLIKCLPSTSDLDKNTIYIQLSEKENKASALIHHLRNAFSHSRIYQDDNYYFFDDSEPYKNKVTMKGCIEKNKLKELMFLLYKQMEERIDKLIHKEDKDI